MKKNDNNSEAAMRRKKALELLKKRPVKSPMKLSEVDTVMLAHERELHLIELELQNEELILAKSILHKAVEKYAELYDFAPSGYFTLTRDGKIIELNFQGSRMLGKEKAKLINSHLDFFISSDTKPNFNQFLKAIFNGKTSQSCEATLLVKDKPQIYVHMNGIMAGNESLCHITVIDISRRKKIDMAIKQSEERELGLLNNLEAGVVVHNPDTSIVKSNPKASELLGLSEGQMRGKLAIDPNWRFMDENNMPLPIERYPVNVIITTKKPIKNLILAVNRPVTNDFVWLKVNGFPVFNGHGEIMEIIISFIDITELEETQREKAKEHSEHEALISSSIDLLWSINNNYKLIAANNRFINSLMTNAGFLIKTGDYVLNPDFFPEDYLQYWRGIYDKALAGETVLTEIYTPRAQSSDLNWFELKIDPIWVDKKITGIACSMRDITERKKADLEIVKANERYELIGNATNDGLWDWDLETGNIWGNNIHQQLYGLTMHDKAPGYEQWKERIHPDDREVTVKRLEQGIVSNTNDLIEEYRFNSEEKGWIHIYGRTFIIRDKDGKAVRLIGSMMDITQRRKAELHLIDSEERLRLSLKAANQGLFDINVQTGEAIVNDEYTLMLGYDPATFVETYASFLERLHPQDLASTAKAYTDYIAGKSVDYKVEFRQRTKDNKWKWILSLGKIVALNSEGKPLRILGTHTDITERKDAENALQNAEQRLQFLLSSTPAVIYSAQAVFPFAATFISENIIEQTGYPAREFVGMPDFWLDNIHPDDIDSVTKERAHLFTKKHRTHEYRFRIKDGSYVWMHDEAKLIVDADGKPLEIVGYWININERKKAEKAINASEEKYRTLVEQASDAIFIADENGKFITVNSSACKLSGFTEKEFLQKTIHDFSVFHDIQKNPFHFEELKKGKTTLVERIIKVKDDEVIEVEVNAKLLSDGRLLAFVRDISERKKSQQALAESENRLRTIYNTEPECIKILGPGSELMEMNPAGLAMIEADHLNQVKGRSIINIIKEPYRKAFKALIQNVFKGKQGQLQFEITGIKGTPRWMDTHAVPLKNSEGKIISLLGVTRDITERKKAEAEILKTTEQLRQLTAHLQTIREEERKNIAREIHDELGQQLTGLKMDIHWLSRRINVTDEETKRKMKESISLIDDTITSVRKIATNLRPSILDDLGLLAALEWQGEEFQKRSGTKVVFVNKVGEISLPPDIATAIFRIYQELLTNIARHANASLVKTVLHKVNGLINFSFSDNGVGFSSENIRNKKTLGLLGIKERTLLFGGSCKIESKPGEGSTTTISIPMKLLTITN